MRTLFSNGTVIDGLGNVLENRYVVVEDQTTTVVASGFVARRDADGNLQLWRRS